MLHTDPRALLSLLVAAALSAQDRPDPEPTDAATRLGYWRQHLEMQEVSPFRERAWRHIGPMQMSGRVTDLAVHPDHPHRIFVATASGGVWKTDNEGTTWVPLFDDAPSGSTGAIAVDPGDPDRVWVGLGEANIFRSSMSGTGVYLSTDGGATWQHRGLAETHHIARIVAHPEDPDTVYVAASGREWTDNPDRGVYKTTDGGASWEKVLFVDDRTGAIDLVMDPRDPDVLYASMWHRIRLKWSDPKPGPGDGIFKTTDGGATWRHLHQGLPPAATTGRIGLALSASDPDRIYALLDNHQVAREAEEGERDSYGRQRRAVKKGAEVYCSDDGGEGWRKVSNSPRLMQRLFSTYGWVFGQIRVDPTDADTVYVLGVPLLKSTDGGVTFRRLRHRGLHGDHHALWIDPADPQRLINGNDGGVNISYDGGETWVDYPNLPVVQFYNVAYDMREPFYVYGSIQDNGSWMGPVTFRPGIDPDHLWQRAPGGEASYHAVDPSDPNVLYSEGFYGRIQRSTLEPRKTVDIAPDAGPGVERARGQWLAPFLISPHNPYVIYHGMQYVFRSVDRGEHWERISDDLSHDDPAKKGDIPYQTITALDESPRRFGLLYAGTDDGRLHVTPDGGRSWTEISGGLPDRWVSRVIASRYDEDRVYVTLNGKRDNDHRAYVFRSEDRGRTWEDISHGVPGGPVNVIREDPHRQSVLYLGTDLGVYVSMDGGEEWHVLGTGLPITFVHDLIVHPRDRIVVAATHGRGMWALDAPDVRQF